MDCARSNSWQEDCLVAVPYVETANHQQGHASDEERGQRDDSNSVCATEPVPNAKESMCEVDALDFDIPRDWCSVAIFLLFGIGLLTPWNVWIHTISSVIDLYPNQNWAFKGNVASTIPFVFGFVLLASTAHTLSLRTHFVLGYAGIIVAGILWMLSLMIPGAPLIIALTLLFVLSFFTAVASGTLNGFAFLVSSKHAAYVFLGQSLAGVWSYLAYYATSTIFNRTAKGQRLNIAVMMMMAVTIASFCLLWFTWLCRRDFFKALIQNARTRMTDELDSSTTRPMTAGGKTVDRKGIVKSVTFSSHDSSQHTNPTVNYDQGSKELNGGAELLSVAQSRFRGSTIIMKRIYDTARICWSPLLLLVIHFSLSYLVFPSLLAVLKPIGVTIDKQYYATSLQASFQTGSIVGRLAVHFTQNWLLKWVWMLALVRIPFDGLIIASQRFEPESSFITHLAFRLILIFFIGALNGWVGSMATIRTPDKLKGREEIRLAGSLSSFAVVLGITIGGSCSPLTQIGIKPS